VGARAWISIALTTVAGLVLAPAASADSASSSNWAGYAAHRSGVSFQKISASWRQPAVSCVRGSQSYSAYWVGIGGFSPNSSALEQIGTEADCDASGHAVLSAWYELVPAPSIPFSFTLAPGDLIDATVTVKGHVVTMSLYDATRHRGFTKTLTARRVDTSSAEWIVEAPSDCSVTSCTTLPLANFGATSFYGAQAQSTTGRQGSIAGAGWGFTKINLLAGAQRFAAFPGRAAASASPSSLRDGGSSFVVTYAGGGASADKAVRSAVALPVGRLVHPGR
jgi:Peptidase A4 family